MELYYDSIKFLFYPDERIVERAASKRCLEKLIIRSGKEAEAGKGFSEEQLLKLLETRDHACEYGRKHYRGEVYLLSMSLFAPPHQIKSPTWGSTSGINPELESPYIQVNK